MKLLFCDNTIWGLINFRENVFRHFYECGHEIVLVAPTDEATEMKAHIPDYIRFVPVYLDRTSRNPFADLQYMWHLIKIYRCEKPDWIFHYTIKPNIYGTLAAKLVGAKSVAMVAGLGYAFAKKGMTSIVARMLYRLALHFAIKIFVLNTNNRDTLVALRVVCNEKLVLLKGGEGVDTEKIREVPNLMQKNRPMFLMVARVLYDKGYKEFVHAASILREEGVNADFCLLGPVDETYPNAVSRLTIERDVKAGHIRYLGFSDRPLDIMGKAENVIVVPSYHEGMNRSLMEACALGRPIIATDIPGCREMVEDGKNGFLVPSRDGDALAEAMRKYISLSWEQQSQMGHHSRQIAVEKLEIKYVIAEYEKIIQMNSF
jgi:glycosyltransferase involved in cell wall biosynthesis